MTLDEARTRLSTCVRAELIDEDFGDVLVHWDEDGAEIAEGYFAVDVAEVIFTLDGHFRDADARALRECGMLGKRLGEAN
jgi:hypothetical protein